MELKNLPTLIVTFIIIGLVLGTGFLMLREFRDIVDKTSGSRTNETINFPTAAGVLVNRTDFGCFGSLSVSAVYNDSSAPELILPANYSYSALLGRIWNITPLPVALMIDHATGEWLVSYTFEYSNSSACKGIEETIEATEKIQEWLGILVIMFIVGILLFIVYKFAFPSMGGGRAGGGGKFKFKGFGGGGGDSGSAEI